MLRVDPAVRAAPIDVERVRADFPILQRLINGRPLIYLDNAATTQKPRQVIDALVDFYTTTNANVHRGVHTLSVEATDAYEGSRERTGQVLVDHGLTRLKPVATWPVTRCPDRRPERAN